MDAVSLEDWNQLPLSLRQPHGTSSSISDSPILSPSLLPLLIHHSTHPLLYLFHFRLKTNLTPVVSLLPPRRLHGLLPRLFLQRYPVFVFSLSDFSYRKTMCLGVH